jgi:hypothetical protein
MLTIVSIMESGYTTSYSYVCSEDEDSLALNIALNIYE